MAILAKCPECGMSSDALRCPRCNALKVIGCTGSCTLCREGCESEQPCGEGSTPSEVAAKGSPRRDCED